MASALNRLRIGIHIDVLPGVEGGTAQSTQGLISSLGRLEGPEQFLLLAQTPQQAQWLNRHCGQNQKIVIRNSSTNRLRKASVQGSGYQKNAVARIKSMFKPSVEKLRGVMGRLTPQYPTVPLSDGFYESLGCDVLHFPTQPFILCALPTIYNPHDLQHVHYPQFWPVEEILRREIVYRAACRFAHTVVVGSEWIKQDVIRQYAVHADKVQVIPWASPTEQYPQIESSLIEQAKHRLGLPPTYAFYPAVTWPHKNHIRLFEALAELRDRRGLVVNLVCTGAKYESHWPKIEHKMRELNLVSQVRFLGFVSEADLRAVYRLAQFLVLPTLFEADSCPIHEAWSEGIPVASSNHTALPEQVGDAGLLFDANDVSGIADAVARMATDAGLREDLARRGNRRLKDFDWTRTAKAYRAVYRRAAGVALNEEDRWLLKWNWMRDPQRNRYHRACPK
jgi:glycosyltransferase involved in cell wall biosynthesis